MGGESLQGFGGGLVTTGRYQAGQGGLLFIHQAFVDIYSILGTVLGPGAQR